MLREQLEQASLANEALSRDIRRLTADWTKAREELEQKESDWRREEEVSKAPWTVTDLLECKFQTQGSRAT